MELNKSILLNKAMIWGLFTGIASILVVSAFYIAGQFLSPALGWVLFLVYTGGIIMSAKAYKKAIAEDAPFAYGKAVGLGVATLFFASIIMALFIISFMPLLTHNLLIRLQPWLKKPRFRWD